MENYVLSIYITHIFDDGIWYFVTSTSFLETYKDCNGIDVMLINSQGGKYNRGNVIVPLEKIKKIVKLDYNTTTHQSKTTILLEAIQ